ncbi:hypothetical protein E2C01_025805 [Portunus trituberculatus]|uniref:Uncharacterized protein n=1 Tax=Portunus trituberculatus TaxID=210409 RepID=A0A5B7EIY2_PORTR|nr:hypothetical protein [Portunus trituberculatus]
MYQEEGGGGVVDKVVSMGSGRRLHVALNPTTYRFEAVICQKRFTIMYNAMNPFTTGIQTSGIKVISNKS